MRGRTCPFGRLVDCRTVSEFAREVVGRRNAFGYLTFGHAIQMVTAMSYDPAHCFSLGLSGYRFFPSIKYWDEHRHLKAKWNFTDFVELHQPAEIPSAAARAASYLGDVCAKLDELGLSYSRNLVKYREHGMPWLERCIERLPRGMPKYRAITALAFLSCVGLIQNGDYVCFNKLAELERALPVTQRHLQELQDTRPPTSTSPGGKGEKEEEEVIEEQIIERIELTSVPASTNSRWTNLEVSYIDPDPALSHNKAYGGVRQEMY
ncbi:hypothetical protein PO909_002425 [Leuciscus waleckii]